MAAASFFVVVYYERLFAFVGALYVVDFAVVVVEFADFAVLPYY